MQGCRVSTSFAIQPLFPEGKDHPNSSRTGPRGTEWPLAQVCCYSGNKVSGTRHQTSRVSADHQSHGLGQARAGPNGLWHRSSAKWQQFLCTRWYSQPWPVHAIYVYIYIYREREREREMYTYIYRVTLRV